MSTFLRLTESDVRRWVGEASFGSGQRYFRQGHILNPHPAPSVTRSVTWR